MAFFRGIAEGLGAFNEGRLLMKKHPELWHYALTPILLTIVVSIFSLALFLGLVAFYMHQMHAQYAGHWWGGIVEILFGIALVILACGFSIAVYLILGAVLAGVYFARLAKRAEILLGMPPEMLRDVHWGWQFLDVITDLGILLGTMFLCMCISWCVPLVGWILSPLVSFYVNFYVFGAQYLDFPLYLRGMLRFTRRAIAHKHLGHTLGMGAVVFFFQFIPILGGIVLAWTVLGAVLILRREEPQLGPPPKIPNRITATTVDVKRLPP